MSRKRSMGDVIVQGCQDVALDAQWSTRDQQCSQKRSCGTSTNPAPGQLKPEEVNCFLQSLLGPQLQNIQSLEILAACSGLDAAGFQSFAELNAVMDKSFHMLAGAFLRGYHSFTTQERLSLWLNYAKAHKITEAAAKAPAPGSYSPRYLQLVRFMLEWVLAGDVEASITEYEMALPPWMVGYAARWGWGSQGTLGFLVLQAYQPVQGSSRASSSRQPMRRVFIPKFQ